MVNPVPGRTITTAYGKRGQHWSCNRDSNGNGVHTGADYAAPKGTPVVAARPGTVRHTSYGTAFGPYQFAVRCSDGTEDFYAHTLDRPANNAQVTMGQEVARVGDLGNVTGPHLHFERHKTQGTWSCSNHTNPQPSIDYGGTPVQPGPVYVSKLVYKQDDSDSVRRLQDTLNSIKLEGGAELPITGGYFDKTRAEVAKWQTQKAADKSVTDGSKVTPTQANQLFAGTGNTVIDDVTTPEPEPPTPPDATTFDAFGLWKWYSGKPAGEQTVHPDGEWHKLTALTQPASGIKEESSEHHFLYLRVELPKGRTADRVLETKFVRSDGDATAYDSEEYGLKKDSHPYYNIHFEEGSGIGGQWWVKVTGGTDPIRLTTRYAKTHVYYVDEQAVTRRATG